MSAPAKGSYVLKHCSCLANVRYPLLKCYAEINPLFLQGNSLSNARAQAASLLAPILNEKQSLKITQGTEHSALLRELCYGSLRLYPRLKLILDELVSKPLKPKDSDIQALLVLGLYQLFHMRIPDHAVLDETVKAASTLNKKWAKGLINGVLRTALRQRNDIESKLSGEIEYQTTHPAWLAIQIHAAWPDQAEKIFAAGNERPPMTIRVNQQLSSVASYISKLEAADIPASALDSSNSAIKIDPPVAVSLLPGFDAGSCSVQDEAAQWATEFFPMETKHRVLDACAAPGGKTCHLLETAPDIALTAIDVDEKRTELVQENLSRLSLNAEVVTADAADTDSWWDGKSFHRILIDAPCSGTGVIRRHPDIKILRRPTDIQSFCDQQRRLLKSLWPLLDQDGLLLYVTCSIMPDENEEQILAFLNDTPNAVLEPLDRPGCLSLTAGLQSLPSIDGADGFYFALLRKSQ